MWRVPAQVKAYWVEASIRSRLWGRKNGGQKTSIFPRTPKDPCFRTRLIEELDVLCRLAAKYKAVK